MSSFLLIHYIAIFLFFFNFFNFICNQYFSKHLMILRDHHVSCCRMSVLKQASAALLIYKSAQQNLIVSLMERDRLDHLVLITTYKMVKHIKHCILLCFLFSLQEDQVDAIGYQKSIVECVTDSKIETQGRMCLVLQSQLSRLWKLVLSMIYYYQL